MTRAYLGKTLIRLLVIIRQAEACSMPRLSFVLVLVTYILVTYKCSANARTHALVFLSANGCML